MTGFTVFGGWDQRQDEAAEVGRHALVSNASIGIDFQPLMINELPISRQGTTEFTFARFLCPWLCQFQGRALFLDCVDMLCLGDVRELAEWDMKGKPLWVVKHGQRERLRSWSSLMLMDCAQLTSWTTEYVETAPDDALMKTRDLSDEHIGALPSRWNILMPSDGPRDAVLGAGIVSIAHWSYLSNPDGGSWIDRSGSLLWAEWRDRWRKTT